MLMNFDTDLDVAGVSKMVKTQENVEITETVTVHQRPSQATAFVAKTDDEWAWDDLRDYVVREIEARHGMFPRSPVKEAGIFKSFLARYGDKAPAIARYAFEVAGGVWKGAPISVTRFCKASDPYFGDLIVEKLAGSTVTGW